MGRKNWFIPVVLTVLVLSLSSCSWFGTQQTCAPVVSKIETPVLPEEPQLPYKSVDYKYPLTAACNPKIYIYKSKRRLLVVQNDVLIRDYRIGLGPRPSGDKQFQGDGRTPEGEFFVCVKNPNSNYYKSLGLSYPSPKHAERALVAGNITNADFRKIVEAINSRSRPPWDTVLGGQIFIHGGGAQDDWTKGCIATYNSDMDELFAMISVGTPVQVLP
jgi:murein L,D-transpeptidase YafK